MSILVTACIALISAGAGLTTLIVNAMEIDKRIRQRRAAAAKTIQRGWRHYVARKAVDVLVTE